MGEASLVFADRVRDTGLPLDKIIIVGSGILDTLGMRRADDVDIVATADVCAQVKEETHYRPKDVPGDVIYEDVARRVAVSLAWAVHPDGKNAYYDDLLPYTTEIDGVRYVSLDYLLAWKRWKDREKDQADIALIEEYFRAQKVDNDE